MFVGWLLRIYILGLAAATQSRGRVDASAQAFSGTDVVGNTTVTLSVANIRGS